MATSRSRQWIALQKQLVPKEKGPGSSYQKNVRRRHKEAIENALQKGYLKVLASYDDHFPRYAESIIIRTLQTAHMQWKHRYYGWVGNIVSMMEVYTHSSILYLLASCI